MKRLFLILLICIVSVNALTIRQYRTMKYIFNRTKAFNLGYTMSAIAMKESDLGKYTLTINKSSVDCSIFMINSKTLSNNKWSQSRVCERLIKDKDFAISVALKRFKYFYDYYRSKGFSRNISWRRAVMSYHSGWNYKAGREYLKDILKNIKVIKKILSKRR